MAGYPGQFGNVLITKSSFDKFINTMVGVPVIINHKDITVENADDERVGVVSSVWYDDKDGWFWCEGVIWDETAQNLITNKGWSVSCSYDVKLADDAGGTENNIPYDMEFLDGVFTHLAIVENPRYERANIVFNSKTIIQNNIIDRTGREHDEKTGQFVGNPSKRYLTSDGKRPIENLYTLHENNVENEPEVYTGSRKFSDVLKYLGSSDGRTTKIKSPIEQITFNRNNLSHYLLDNEPERLRDLNKVVRTLQAPNVVIKTFEEGTEKNNYIKIFNTGTKNKPHLEVIKCCDDGNFYVTNIRLSNSKFTKFLQEGKVIYDVLNTPKINGSQIKNDLAYDMTAIQKNVSVNDIITHSQEDFNPKEQEMLNNVENDKWITIHPNGEDSKGRPLLLKDGETPKEAIDRTYGGKKLSDEAKKEAKTIKDNYINGDNISLSQYQKKAKEFEEKYGVPLHEVTEEEAPDFSEEKKGLLKELVRKSGAKTEKEFMLPYGNYGNLSLYLDKELEKKQVRNIGDITMTALNALEDFVKNVIKNTKGDDMEDDKKVENEKVDKRKLIDEIGGILKGKVDEEVWRTIIGKAEKLSYNGSEDDKADNKKVKNETEDDKEKVEELKKEVKEDVENKKKCDNSVDNSVDNSKYFDKINEIYNSAQAVKEECLFVSREDKLNAANEYFAK